jgi:hypothetical protein
MAHDALANSSNPTIRRLCARDHRGAAPRDHHSAQMLQLDGRYEPQYLKYDSLLCPSWIAPLLIAPLILGMAAATRLEAQVNDMFATKAAAMQRTLQLKCTGAFAIGQQWTPCKDLEAYEKAVRQR